MEQRIIHSQNLEGELAKAMAQSAYDRVFVLCDENTKRLCWPLVSGFDCLKQAILVTIPADDINKNLASVEHIWQQLQQNGATRHSLQINLGGGMVTDLGGFAASCFKRGIDFINIPTTLLSMVDASVGGKTGINFGGLKNEIGCFNESKYVILDTMFLATLDDANIRSGYAEMLKHALISDAKGSSGQMLWTEMLNFDLAQPDFHLLAQMLADSVEVKRKVVEQDPHEHGLRKALNLGHTIGHAFESWAMRKDCPVLHGYAVAYGLVAELYLAVAKTGFPVDVMRQTVRFILDCYGRLPITCKDYDELYELMTHDKKNTAGVINFTLLSAIGKVEINQSATKDEIFEALDFYREG